ncbi:hypothetical protein VKT23_006299 [Stygiomarasmius scandens]|uniref:DUF6534 domain-containing protein n=1 Tax=Marasmiellus scandens TaxID=2682957 RepID=A0ABR1JMF1_9AGAR
MRDMFAYFGTNFGNVEEFQKLRLGGWALPITTGIITCTVQTFYAYQIYVISRSKLLVGLITLLAMSQMIAGFMATAKGVQIKLIPALRKGEYVECTVWLVGSALGDIIIAFIMTIYLCRAGYGFKKTQHAPLRRLVRLIVETGTATAAFASAGCILFLVNTHNYHQIPVKSLGKIYVSSLLVIFNSRMRIVGSRHEIRPEDATLYLSWISSNRQDTSNDHARMRTNVSPLAEIPLSTRLDFTIPERAELRHSSYPWEESKSESKA